MDGLNVVGVWDWMVHDAYCTDDLTNDLCLAQTLGVGRIANDGFRLSLLSSALDTNNLT
jgi:hypothetical protein